jgi:hypothetical protein
MRTNNKGFRGKRALSPALNLVDKLIGLNPAIPYEIVQLNVVCNLTETREFNNRVHYIKKFRKIF